MPTWISLFSLLSFNSYTKSYARSFQMLIKPLSTGSGEEKLLKEAEKFWDASFIDLPQPITLLLAMSAVFQPINSLVHARNDPEPTQIFLQSSNPAFQANNSHENRTCLVIDHRLCIPGCRPNWVIKFQIPLKRRPQAQIKQSILNLNTACFDPYL